MWIILLLLCVCSSQTERVRKKCELPELRHGFVVPEKDDYEHNSDLYYGCDKGWKPAIKTWWPALKCNDGKWSHTPECIDQNACIATMVPHAQLVNDFSSWYANNTVVQYKCNPGYGSVETDKATCVNGRWTLPQCKQKNGVCNPPAQIYNVIILTPYQDVFEHDQRLKYVCRSGYKMDGRDFSVCKNGAWSDQLRCVPEEHSPAPEKPKLVERPTQPDLNNNERTFARETENEDHHRPAYSRPSHIIHCGSYPTIENGDVFEQQNGRALIVQCARFYKLEGEDKVMCVNKKWTTLPVCKEPCKLNTRLFHYHKPEYMQDGEEIYDYCRESWEKMHVKCINAQAFYRGCGFSEW